MMFKILILQRFYNISDDQTEYMINDRMSFQRFIGLTLADKVPDAKTIWAFREALSQKDKMKNLFKKFNVELERSGIIAHETTFALTKRLVRQMDDEEQGKSLWVQRPCES